MLSCRATQDCQQTFKSPIRNKHNLLTLCIQKQKWGFSKRQIQYNHLDHVYVSRFASIDRNDNFQDADSSPPTLKFIHSTFLAFSANLRVISVVLFYTFNKTPAQPKNRSPIVNFSSIYNTLHRSFHVVKSYFILEVSCQTVMLV